MLKVLSFAERHRFWEKGRRAKHVPDYRAVFTSPVLTISSTPSDAVDH